MIERILGAIIACLIVITFAGCGGGGESNHKPNKVLIIGDSLSDPKNLGEGKEHKFWTSQLERELTSDGYEVTFDNQAFGGESSRDMIKRLDDYIASDPDIVFIFIGTNDPFHPTGVTHTKGNIQMVVDTLNRKPRKFILVNLVHPKNYAEEYVQNDMVVQTLSSIVPDIVTQYPNMLFVENYYKDVPEDGLTIDGFHVKPDYQHIIKGTMRPFFEQSLH